MRLAVLYGSTYPEGMAMSKRLHLYSKGLFELDTKVTIIMQRPHSSTNDIYHAKTHYQKDGVKFYYIQAGRKSLNPLQVRIVNIIDNFSYCFHAFRTKGEFDIFWLIGFSWFGSFLVASALKLGKKKILIEVNENPYSDFGNKSDFKIIKAFQRWLMLNIVYKLFDGFVVISETLKELVCKYKKRNASVIKVPILIDSGRKLNKIKTPDPYIFHAGTLNEKKDGILPVFEGVGKAFSDFNGPFEFILSNNSTHPDTLKKINLIISKYNIKDRVKFHNYLGETELQMLMDNSSLAIVNRPDNNQNKYNFSTKLGEYMSKGIPLITTKVGEMGKYLFDNENCLVISPDDSDEIALKIKEIYQNPELAQKIGAAGRLTAVQNFDFRVHALRLHNFINSIATIC